ncbi:S8 family peptidase [Novosphingobium terrae]|uniref:S8 family peptidase n=1 Tax=Novosphingobium terrae TaxID=2726189 RepID=UPI00197D73D7|nr:S8 family peptidase [Novosphingobium terrae]
MQIIDEGTCEGHRDPTDAALPGSMVQRIALCGVALSALALLAACGSDGGSGVSSTPAPSSTPTPTPTTSASPTPTATPTTTPTSTFMTAEYNRSTGPSQHGAITAWSMGATGAGVTIGIVDSGLDTTNPEFTGRISSASADVAGSRGLINADSDHGTMVALVAAAARNNSGIMGMAYGATVAAFRADTAGSCASSGGCTFSDTDIASGVNAAINAGAKVINLSLGGGTPSSAVTTAISRAASAGIVVIVAAGNDGTANPDAFASGVRAAGNGNVIIAGSVNSSNVISSFSDKAGTEAANYLTALGEGICCEYANGQIKTTTTNGATYVTVYSGTSFSAPQIAGAVALLMQYFPNLSAKQAVTLLLNTATREGTGAGDTTYGAGVLNIASAFTAQGTTTMGASSQKIALGDTTIATSPAMGDAAHGASLQAVVLDSYNRAFQVNLAASMRQAMIQPRLMGALDTNRTATTLGTDALSLAFTVDGQHHLSANLSSFARQMQLTPGDSNAARVLAARVVAHLTPGATLAMAFAQGSDGLTAQLQGQSRPAFLIATNPLEDTGFLRGGQSAMAVRHQLGRWGMTVFAENGRAQLSTPWHQGALSDALQKRDSATRVGLSMDRRFGTFETSFGASWMTEDHTLLGARLADTFGARGAETLFLDSSMGWRPEGGWYLGAAWREAFTRARGGTLVTDGSRLTSYGWSIDAGMINALAWGDSLSLRVSQPLRVARGGVNLYLPDSYDYATQEAVWSTHRLNLAPTGREIAAELAWHAPMFRGDGTISVFWRKEPGNYAGLPDDSGMAWSWRKGF